MWKTVCSFIFKGQWTEGCSWNILEELYNVVFVSFVEVLILSLICQILINFNSFSHGDEGNCTIRFWLRLHSHFLLFFFYGKNPAFSDLVTERAVRIILSTPKTIYAAFTRVVPAWICKISNTKGRKMITMIERRSWGGGNLKHWFSNSGAVSSNSHPFKSIESR